MANNNETVEQVCEIETKNRSQTYNDKDRLIGFSQRILAAHKRELAAKDAEIARLKRENFDLNGCLLAEQELAEKRNALIRGLADALDHYVVCSAFRHDKCPECDLLPACELIKKAREVCK